MLRSLNGLSCSNIRFSSMANLSLIILNHLFGQVSNPILVLFPASSIWLVGTDEHVNFWLDNWIGSPLVNLINIPIYVDPSLTCKHFSAIVAGQWNIPLMVMRNPNIVSSILKIILLVSPIPDELVSLHTFDTFQFGCTLCGLVFLHIILLSFLRLVHRKRPTDDNLQLKGCIVISVCVL